jgi:hypothetical protein
MPDSAKPASTSGESHQIVAQSFIYVNCLRWIGGFQNTHDCRFWYALDTNKNPAIPVAPACGKELNRASTFYWRMGRSSPKWP